MNSEEPEIVESLLLWLYTMATDFLYDRMNGCKDDRGKLGGQRATTLGHLLKLFITADKYDQPLLKQQLSIIVQQEATIGGEGHRKEAASGNLSLAPLAMIKTVRPLYDGREADAVDTLRQVFAARIAGTETGWASVSVLERADDDT